MDSVKMRLERDQELSFIEFNYMCLQAYDFVELNRRYGCLAQMGGSDQWGNIVTGIDLGRRMGTPQLYALTAPLLTTHEGHQAPVGPENPNGPYAPASSFDVRGPNQAPTESLTLTACSWSEPATTPQRPSTCSAWSMPCWARPQYGVTNERRRIRTGSTSCCTSSHHCDDNVIQ